MSRYELLKMQIEILVSHGLIPTRPDREARISWALGQTRFRWPDFTREEAERIVDANDRRSQNRACVTGCDPR